MIDAYTIGITLALEDGVSAGIATIRHDLLAFDRAIQDSAAGLLALRRLGQQMSVVGTGEPPPAPSRAPPVILPPAGPATSTPDAASPTDAAITPAPSLAPSPILRTSTGAEKAALIQTLAEERSPAAPGAVQNKVRPRATQPTRSESIAPPNLLPKLPSQRSAGQTQAIQLRNIAEFAPRALQAPKKFSADPPQARPLAEDRALTAESPVRQPPKPPSGAPLPAVLAAPPVRFDPAQRPVPAAPDETARLIPSSPGAAPRPARLPEDQPLRSAPTWLPEDRTLHSAPGRRFRDSPAAMPPPSRNEASSAGLSGEIMLDGSRLGRWVADTLTRMTERVPSGSTGIDPRASPGWPAIQAD